VSKEHDERLVKGRVTRRCGDFFISCRLYLRAL